MPRRNKKQHAKYTRYLHEYLSQKVIIRAPKMPNTLNAMKTAKITVMAKVTYFMYPIPIPNRSLSCESTSSMDTATSSNDVIAESITPAERPATADEKVVAACIIPSNFNWTI